MQNTRGAAEPAQQQGARGTEEGGNNQDDHIRLPAPLGEQGEEGSEGKACQVQQALQGSGAGRDVQGAAGNPNAMLNGSLPPKRAVIGLHLPIRVIGRGGDNTNVMALRGKPGRHVTRVLADAGELGGVVEAVDQQFHGAVGAGDSNRANRKSA